MLKRSVAVLSSSLLFYCLHAQVRFGILAGPQANTVSYKVDGVKQDNSFKAGFQLGGVFKVPFENRLSFSPAIQYNYRGYKVNLKKAAYPPGETATDNNTSFHTIELAFLLQHDFKTQPGHFFFRFGPSLDFALFGKEEFNTTGNGKISRDMKFGFAHYGHYLASAIVQLGFESPSGAFLYAHYNYSLTNMNNADGGPQIGNRSMGISFGKYFRNKKIVLDTRNRE